LLTGLMVGSKQRVARNLVPEQPRWVVRESAQRRPHRIRLWAGIQFVLAVVYYCLTHIYGLSLTGNRRQPAGKESSQLGYRRQLGALRRFGIDAPVFRHEIHAESAL